MSTYFESAIFKINFVSATLYKDLAVFGKMDPYLEFQFADQKLQSRAHENGGINPVWNNSHFIQIHQHLLKQEVTLTVYSQGLRNDGMIATGKFELREFLSGQFKGKQGIFKLFEKNKNHVATIYINTEYIQAMKNLCIPQSHIQLTLIQGFLHRDTEIIGKMDPYVVFSHQDIKVRSKTKSNAGQKPVWGETFSFKSNNLYEDLDIQVFDEDLIGSKVAGKLQLDVKFSEIKQQKFDAKSQGELYVKLVHGTFLRNQDLLSKMDPRVMIEIGDESFLSRAHQNGGVTPFWNETIVIKLTNLSQEATFRVEDEDIFYHDFIGDMTISLQKLIQNHIDIYPVYDKDKKVSGFIFLEVRYIEKQIQKIEFLKKRTVIPKIKKPEPKKRFSVQYGNCRRFSSINQIETLLRPLYMGNQHINDADTANGKNPKNKVSDSSVNSKKSKTRRSSVVTKINNRLNLEISKSNKSSPKNKDFSPGNRFNNNSNRNSSQNNEKEEAHQLDDLLKEDITLSINYAKMMFPKIEEVDYTDEQSPYLRNNLRFNQGFKKESGVFPDLSEKYQSKLKVIPAISYEDVEMEQEQGMNMSLETVSQVTLSQNEQIMEEDDDEDSVIIEKKLSSLENHIQFEALEANHQTTNISSLKPEQPQQQQEQNVNIKIDNLTTKLENDSIDIQQEQTEDKTSQKSNIDEEDNNSAQENFSLPRISNISNAHEILRGTLIDSRMNKQIQVKKGIIRKRTQISKDRNRHILNRTTGFDQVKIKDEKLKTQVISTLEQINKLDNLLKSRREQQASTLTNFFNARKITPTKITENKFNFKRGDTRKSTDLNDKLFKTPLSRQARQAEQDIKQQLPKLRVSTGSRVGNSIDSEISSLNTFKISLNEKREVLHQKRFLSRYAQ
ncbi:c2 domain containing protein [Stylonychia lemnae]|uniref:C2 domain containing protein n=1 Tax=Stylonychia lemnae TaxID=5949 RepID=A0A078B7Z8_STYLE|nr:c2 domain containing protein [Stylonychia lemnae]|eukprot:CDW90650.1 c2 domain containing protein [Stylonychia lemnae]